MQLSIVQCPQCRSEMVTQRRHGVEVDLCPFCRGVWLDRGELDQIVERSSRYTEIEEVENQRSRQHERRIR